MKGRRQANACANEYPQHNSVNEWKVVWRDEHFYVEKTEAMAEICKLGDKNENKLKALVPAQQKIKCTGTKADVFCKSKWQIFVKGYHQD